mmetsp:Transcript_43374/g.114438  ORF Transcript_43374/g.114438 Transcript_43374/m.114438 type:complete len:299 (-) Transcript_43374:1192-2088(-)
MSPGHLRGEQDHDVIRAAPGIDSTARGVGIDDALSLALGAGHIARTTYIHPADADDCPQVHPEHATGDMHDESNPVTGGRENAGDLSDRPSSRLLHLLLVLVQCCMRTKATHHAVVFSTRYIRPNQFPGLQRTQGCVVPRHHPVTDAPHKITHLLKAERPNALLLAGMNSTRRRLQVIRQFRPPRLRSITHYDCLIQMIPVLQALWHLQSCAEVVEFAMAILAPFARPPLRAKRLSYFGCLQSIDNIHIFVILLCVFQPSHARRIYGTHCQLNLLWSDARSLEGQACCKRRSTVPAQP